MKKSNQFKKLKGANMDIDLVSEEKDITWNQDKCPWSEEDGNKHKCTVKNISLCKYFKGIAYPDKVLCSYKPKLKIKNKK